MVLNRGGSKQMSREIVLKQAIIAIAAMAFLALGFPQDAGAATTKTVPAWTNYPSEAQAVKDCSQFLHHACRPPDFYVSSWTIGFVNTPYIYRSEEHTV